MIACYWRSHWGSLKSLVHCGISCGFSSSEADNTSYLCCWYWARMCKERRAARLLSRLRTGATVASEEGTALAPLSAVNMVTWPETLPNSKKGLGRERPCSSHSTDEISPWAYDQNVVHGDPVTIIHIPATCAKLLKVEFWLQLQLATTAFSSLGLSLSNACLTGKAGRTPVLSFPLNVKRHEFMGLGGNDRCLPLVKPSV